MITEWEKIKVSAALMSRAPELNVRDDADILKVQQEIEKIKQNAKEFYELIDGNGGPLAVYHGTDRDWRLKEPEKTVFDKKNRSNRKIRRDRGIKVRSERK